MRFRFFLKTGLLATLFLTAFACLGWSDDSVQKPENSTPQIQLDESLYALYHQRADVIVQVTGNDSLNKKGSLKLTLVDADSGKAIDSKTLRSLSEEPITVSFSLKGKPAGIYQISAELSSGEKVLASKVSQKYPYKPDPKIRFNKDGFLVVDGKPFFPIGIYTLQDKYSNSHDAILSEAREAGFNSTVYYAETPETIMPLLDAAGRNGIKAFIYPTTAFSDRKTQLSLEQILQALKVRKDKPALLGWYLADEPEGIGKALPGMVRELYQIVKEYDQDHPCSVVVMSGDAAARYKNSADVMWIDPYPVPDHPVSYVSEKTTDAVNGVQKDKPVWVIPQAFDWSVWNTGNVNGTYRPTDDEERCMTYLALVHEAKGIIYWAHTASRYYIRDYPQHWEKVKSLAGEMKVLEPALLTNSVNGVLNTSTDTGGLNVMVKQLKGKYYVFAVNPESKPCDAQFKMRNTRIDSTIKVLFEKNRTVSADRDTWADHFKPLEVHVYEIEASAR